MFGLIWSILLGAPAALAQAWTPSPAEAEAIAALSVRHDPVPCATLVAHLPAPGASLARIADEIALPPWVGVRAAACAAPLADARPRVLAWIGDPARRGLVQAVIGRLDALPPDEAASVARALLDGPHAAALGPRLAHSAHAPVRALTATP